MTALYIDDEPTHNPSLRDVEEALERLDGRQRTLVLLELPSGRTLTVGGGPDRFVAEVAESDTVRWAVIDSTNGDDPIALVVGGQLAEFPARVCVERAAVLAAARTFLGRDGAREQSLTWSRET